MWWGYVGADIKVYVPRRKLQLAHGTKIAKNCLRLENKVQESGQIHFISVQGNDSGSAQKYRPLKATNEMAVAETTNSNSMRQCVAEWGWCVTGRLVTL